MNLSSGFSLRTVAYHLVGQPYVEDSKVLKRVLWRVFFGNRVIPFLGKYHYFAQLELDKELAKTLGTNGFYVEVGANDGLSFSNTKHLELYLGWSGILVEPHLGKLETSKLHRSQKNSFVHAACVRSDFEQNQVELIYSNLMTTLNFPSADLADPLGHAQEGSKFLGPNEHVEVFVAPAKPLVSILRDCNAPRDIDFLSIDIEGHDFEILEDFDWSYNIKYILVESFTENRFDELLESKGYSRVLRDQAHNILYVKR